MTAKQRRALWWFREWEAKGYSATYGTSGHYRVTDPDGLYVATISSSPSSPKASEYETGRISRRHGQNRDERR